MKKLLALGLLLAATSAFAVPTQFGYSGGFTVPDAQIQQGVSLTMTVDESENFSTVIPEGPFPTALLVDSSDIIPKTQLSFSIGTSWEFALGYHKRETSYTPLDFEFSPFTKANPFALFVTTMDTTNLSAKYALPYTPFKGKYAIGMQYDTTNVEINGFMSDGDSFSINRWVGLLTGTFPVFDANTSLTVALMPVWGDTDDRTSIGIGLERRMANNAAVGVEYILNSPNDYLPMFEDNEDFGTIYATLPFGDMFTGRLALTSINVDPKLAYSLTAKF